MLSKKILLNLISQCDLLDVIIDVIAYNVKLNFEKVEDESRAEAVFDTQKLCWNHISELVFTNKPKGTKEVHDLVS